MFGFGKQSVEAKVRDGATAYALKSIIQLVEVESAYHGKGCLWLMVNAGAFKNSVFCSYLNGWMQGYLKKCGTSDNESRKIWTNFLARDLGPSLAIWHSELGIDKDAKRFDLSEVAQRSISVDASSSIARAEGLNDGARSCAAMLDWERNGNPPTGINSFDWLLDQMRTKNLLAINELRQSGKNQLLRDLGFE